MSIRTLRYGDMELERPVAIVGFPGAGLVSSIAPNYLITQLDMVPVAGFASPDMPPYCLIADGMALPPVRVYGLKGKGGKSRDMAVVMSEYAPKPEDCYGLSAAILDLLRRMGCDTVVCLEGVPKFDQSDEMVVCHSGPGGEKLARKTKIKMMTGGMLRGMTGVIMYSGPSHGMDVVSIVVPASQNYPDPAAASQFIAPMRKLVPGLRLDTKPLLEEAEQIQKKIEEQTAVPNTGEIQYYGRSRSNIPIRFRPLSFSHMILRSWLRVCKGGGRSQSRRDGRVRPDS